MKNVLRKDKDHRTFGTRRRGLDPKLRKFLEPDKKGYEEGKYDRGLE